MGYDVHITRRRRWADEEGEEIAAEEWLAYVRSDPELRLEPDPGHGSPYRAVWRHPTRRREDGPVWFDWRDGELYTKNPDRPMLDKMIAIALHFDATAQGDDGEIYDAADLPPRELPLSFREWTAARIGSVAFRVRDGLNRLFARGREREPPPFGVGDRVRDPFGEEYTVVAIDLAAEHGAGLIRYRRDDGWETRHLWFGGTGYFTRISKNEEP